MPKIKIDTSGVSEEEAKAFGSGSGESPRPGVYRAKVLEINPGYAKDDDGGPDKTKPRLEVIYQIQGGEFANSQIWEYVILPGHVSFGDSAKKRMFQMLRACGQPTSVKEINTDKLVGKSVRIRVRKGTNQEGDYRGEFGAVFKDSDSDIKLTSTAAPAKDDEELLDDGDGGDDVILDDEAGTEETDWDARKEELNAMSGDELKTIAKEWKDNGWDIKIGGKKSEVIDRIIGVEQEAAAQTGDGDDDDVIIDDEDDIITDDDAPEYLTEDQLKAMEGKDLVKLAKDDFDIDAKAQGLTKKSALVAAILEAQAAPGDDDEDMPF